jgi:hypothetical protein
MTIPMTILPSTPLPDLSAIVLASSALNRVSE